MPVPHGDVDTGGGAAPGPTFLERVSLALRAAWRRKWIAAAVFLVGADASVVYYRLKPAVYRVEAIVAQRRQEPPSVRPEAVSDASMRSVREWVHERQNLLALIDEANLLGPQPAELASADLPELVRRGPPGQHPDSAADPDPAAALIGRLAQALKVTTGDRIITVAIEWPDPEQAYRLVKVALKRLAKQAGERFDEVVKPAELPKRPVSPDPLRVFGIGTLASLLLAVAVAAAFELRSGRAVPPRHVENGASRPARREGSAPATQVAIDRGAARHVGPANHSFQELWLTLAQRNWKSLVLVPGDEGESVAAMAASLVNVGRRLRRGPVAFFIIADPIDYDSAARIMAALGAKEPGAGEPTTTPTGQVIATIQPVIAAPLGLAITEAADVAIVCAEVGRTRLAAARRTIDLIGRERIAGCLVLHPNGAPSTNAPSPAPVPPEALRHELQQMWSSLVRGDWSSLVVIPTDGGILAREVVGALHDAAAHEIGRFQVIDAVGVTTDVGERLAREMAAVVAGGTRVVAAVDSPMQSLSGVYLMRDAQAALLVVRLGSSKLEYVRSTIDLVGRERILGAVTLPR